MTLNNYDEIRTRKYRVENRKPKVKIYLLTVSFETPIKYFCGRICRIKINFDFSILRLWCFYQEKFQQRRISVGICWKHMRCSKSQRIERFFFYDKKIKGVIYT